MALLELETRCNRISTSSQTNYPECQKILYARTGNKGLVKGKDRRDEGVRNGLRKFYVSELRSTACGMLREKLDDKTGKVLSVGGKKNWIDEVFDNLKKEIRGNQRLGRYVDKKPEQTHSLKKPKRQNLSKSQEEDLFQEHPRKFPKKQQADMPMHKTFFDIFPNINKKGNSLSLT